VAKVGPKLLFVGVNPIDTPRLRWEEELKRIQRAENRDRRLSIDVLTAVEISDLRRALLDGTPQLLHFSGHGASDGTLAFEDSKGKAHRIAAPALAQLLHLTGGRLGCVVLSACYSDILAQELSKRVPFVIGMRNSVRDDTCIEFSGAFYEAYLVDEDIRHAFEVGLNAINLTGISEEGILELREKLSS
jgi:CHAT domain